MSMNEQKKKRAKNNKKNRQCKLRKCDRIKKRKNYNAKGKEKKCKLRLIGILLWLSFVRSFLSFFLFLLISMVCWEMLKLKPFRRKEDDE